MIRNTLFIWALLLTLFIPKISLAGPPTKKFTVVIDPGHGGKDPGAIGKITKEKTINLKTALALGNLIEKNCPDVKVIYTRKTDVFVELHQRAKIANKAKADLFISIHTNSLPKGKIARGAETYTMGMASSKENLELAKRENAVILMEGDYKTTYKGFNPNSSESYIIFEFMQDNNMSQSVNFAKKVQSQFRNLANRKDKGVKQAGFLVLRETTMPSVLIELGYISTPDEEQYLASEKGTQAMGRSIYQALVNYKKGLSGYGQGATSPEPVKQTTEEDRATASQEKDEESRPATPSVPATKGNASEKPDMPIFKIQILTSDRKLTSGDKRFKGVTGWDYFKEGNIYKYTYGASTNYNEMLKTKREITGKFKDCFIIAFRNGEKMDVNEAIRIFKTNK